MQEEHQKEYKQWNKNLKPRKQKLDDEFRRQQEEQDRFYANNSGFLNINDFTVMMDNHGHPSEDAQEQQQLPNAMTINTVNTSSASDNSNDHYYH